MTERRCTKCNRQITAAPEETAQPQTEGTEATCEICQLLAAGKLFTPADLRECLTRYFLEGVRVGRELPSPEAGSPHSYWELGRDWGGHCAPDQPPDWPPTEWAAAEYALRCRDRAISESRGALDAPRAPRDWACDWCKKSNTELTRDASSSSDRRRELLPGNALTVHLTRGGILCGACWAIQQQWEDDARRDYAEHVDPDVRAARGESPPLT